MEVLNLKAKDLTIQKCIPRIKEKNKAGKSMLKKAQQLLAKKCGTSEGDKTSDNMTLHQYLDMYMQRLSDQAMDAIVKLTKVAQGTKIKKKQPRIKADK
jgi:hypothetical protein